MGGRETAFVQEAFDTNWIAPLGANVDGFERDLAAYTGAAHAAALSSGTAALHLGLVLLGVKAGDLVICQSFTFAASANPITYLGATPVFVDSEPDTWNMCPEALEKAIRACLDPTSPQASESARNEMLALRNAQALVRNEPTLPKAIIPVHLYGMPANMDAICAVADRYGIPVLEDAAEALGSSSNGQKCGTFGRLSVLSFNGNKIITTSGGGALLSDDAELMKRARHLATQARDPAPHYEHSQVGFNYRLSNVLAGIGRGQMLVLDGHIARRRAVFEFYRDRLGRLPGIRFLDQMPGSFSNRWLTTILVDPEQSGGISRESIRLALEADNIESRPLWKPMHMQPVYLDAPYFGGGVAEALFRDGLCLPSGSNLSDDDLERVAGVVEGLWQ